MDGGGDLVERERRVVERARAGEDLAGGRGEWVGGGWLGRWLTESLPTRLNCWWFIACKNRGNRSLTAYYLVKTAHQMVVSFYT